MDDESVVLELIDGESSPLTDDGRGAAEEILREKDCGQDTEAIFISTEGIKNSNLRLILSSPVVRIRANRDRKMEKNEAYGQIPLKSRGDSSQKKDRATWDEKSLKIFISVCVKEVQSGNRPGSHFNKIGWKNVVAKFNDATKKNYDYKQLKNKWDWLKKEWRLWDKFLGKETELAWDAYKKTVHASDEWWDKKLQEYPEASKFKEKGLLCADEMDILFRDVVATGERSWAPSCGILPNDNSGNEELVSDQMDSAGLNHIDIEEDNMHYDEIPFNIIGGGGVNHKGEKRKRLGSMVTRETNKFGTATRTTKAMEKLVKVVQSRTSQSIPIKEDKTSVENIMEVVRGLPGMQVGSELWWQTTKLLLDKTNREMLLAMKEPEVQIEWLKRMTT